MTSEMFLWHSLDHKPQHTSTSTCRGNMLCQCDKPSESHEQQAVSPFFFALQQTRQALPRPTASNGKLSENLEKRKNMWAMRNRMRLQLENLVKSSTDFYKWGIFNCHGSVADSFHFSSPARIHRLRRQSLQPVRSQKLHVRYEKEPVPAALDFDLL